MASAGAKHLGDLLFDTFIETHDPRDLQAAEAAFHRAEERGNSAAAVYLGMVRDVGGDHQGAVAALRRAEEAGEASAGLFLGEVFERHGDLQGAEAAYRRATRSDSSEVAELAAAALRSLRTGTDK